MKRTNKNRQAEYLQTGKSERTAVRAAKCVTDYGQENTDVDFRKDTSAERKAVFRSTAFPADKILVRGSNLDKLVDEILGIIKN